MKEENINAINEELKEMFEFGKQEGLGKAYEIVREIIDDMCIEGLMKESVYNELRKRIAKAKKGEYKNYKDCNKCNCIIGDAKCLKCGGYLPKNR